MEIRLRKFNRPVMRVFEFIGGALLHIVLVVCYIIIGVIHIVITPMRFVKDLLTCDRVVFDDKGITFYQEWEYREKFGKK